MSKKNNLLLIGSHGFLGKNLVNLFNKKGYDKNFNLFEISGKSDLDITEKNEFKKFINSNNISHIINSAAYVGGIGFGYSNPADLLSINLNMAHVLYEVSAQEKVKLLINPISNCAYPGNLTKYEEELFWEGPPHDSVFNYGISKRAFVALGKAYFDQYGLSSANIVMSNMFGPHDHFEEVRSHALGALVSKIADAKKNNKEEVVIWGDGSPIREWLYVEDGADALLKCLNLNEKDYFFNIGVNKGITITDLAIIIAKHLSWNGNFVFDKSKPNGVSEKTVVDKFSKNLINWSPSTELENGIKKTVEWYMENNNV